MTTDDRAPHAAAPALLSALEKLTQSCAATPILGDDRAHGVRTPRQEDVDSALAAIAAAKGE